jgi:hypothetical protein
MNCRAHPRSKQSGQQGYAILMVIFLATLMVILAMAAAPNILTEGRRQKEQIMVWRGHQYVRGIKLYYRKMGHFPTSIDDLMKPQMGNIHFMRKAYKDPMNKEDGSWRLIYVGPSGQLIGSLRPPQTLTMPGVSGAVGTPASQMGSLAGTQTPGTPAGGAQASSGQGGQSNQGGNAESGQGGDQTDQSSDADSDSNSDSGNQSDSATPQSGQATPPQPTSGMPGTSGLNPSPNPGGFFGGGSSGDTGTIMGGNIIGVGSKVNHRSIMVYEKAKNYRLFEFIWDPSKDMITVGGSATPLGPTGAPLGTTTPTGPGMGMPGVGAPGTGTTSPMNPTPPPNEPPTTDQNPPQN